MYERTYVLGGQLTVTPMAPLPGGGFAPVGDPVPAVISEIHRARLTGHYGQVTEGVAQVLLGSPRQALAWRFAAGQRDDFDRLLSCGVE